MGAPRDAMCTADTVLLVVWMRASWPLDLAHRRSLLAAGHLHTKTRALLVFINAHREIRKRMDIDVAFTREYSKVSISTWNVR
jgi:hypothetical protein